METNPVLVREVRARWRKWPAFAIVLGYATLLALAVGWRWRELSRGQGNADHLGREIFVVLTWMQLFGWMLLAPVLTAPALAGEREHGLLDGVQLSRLSAAQIVTGKMLSALCFISLMLLVPLPIVALCFLLGGVSPGEFVASFLLNAATATFCAAIGIASSASQPRTNLALASAIGAMIAWQFGLAFAAITGETISPLHALSIVLSSDHTSFSATSWLWSLIVQGALSLCLLSRAATDLMKLHEPMPAGRDLPEPMLVRVHQSGSGPSEVTAEQPSEWQTMPLAEHFRLTNPVAQREVTRLLRLPRKARLAGIQAAVAFLTIAVIAIMVCFVGITFFDPHLKTRQDGWWMMSCFWMFGLLSYLSLHAAASFTREREAQMLEPLLLSRLTPGEIVKSKRNGLLMAGLYFSLPLPLLLLSGSIPWIPAISTLLVIAATVWAGIGLGLWISACCRSTMVAIGATVATLLLSLWLVPGLFGGANLYWWQPFVTIGKLSELEFGGGQGRGVLATVLPCVLVWFGAGLLCLRLARAALERGAREKDHRFSPFVGKEAVCN